MAVEIHGTIVPKNNGSFPVTTAEHIGYKDGKLTEYMPVCVTQDEYDALVKAGEVKEHTPYLIKSEET